MMRTKNPAGSCTGRPVTAFPSAECIRHIYQPVLPDTWLFGFASKKYHPLDDLNVKRWKERKIKTWYYTTNLHKGAFMLPKYVEDMLEEEEKVATVKVRNNQEK